MSSTSRGSKRRLMDYYATPDWCVDALIRVTDADWTLDPCAGDGALIRGVQRAGGEARGIEIQPKLCELGADYNVSHGDGLAEDWTGERVISNPPYSTSIDWVIKGIRETERCAFLLRLAYLAGQKRRLLLWEHHKPSKVCILSRRPSFTGTGSDSADYAWFVWERGKNEAELLWI